MTRRIALIVAMAENRVIGRAGGLPWHIPADLRHFKAITMGKPIVMGRRTFESIGRPLPGRPNIVVTRDRSRQWPGVEVAHDVEAALALAQRQAERLGVDEILVIGGAALYRAVLPRAERIYLTLVHESVEGDTLFPDYDPAAWRETAREECADIHRVPVSFVVLDRAAGDR